MAEVFGRKAVCIITGASRGIGYEIAIQFAKLVGDNSLFCITARDSEKLNATAVAMGEAAGASGRSIRVVTVPLDLGAAGAAEIDALLDALAIGTERFDVMMLIHNAGSLLCDKSSTQLDDFSEIDNYYHSNFSSAVVLTSKCLSRFGRSINQTILVVNISSLCGVKPMSGCAMYGSVKAARDFYFSVLAVEYNSGLIKFDGDASNASSGQQNPVVRVLSYAPGPVLTDMARQYCEQIANPSARETWESRIPKLLTCEQTISRLIDVLRKNTFESGAHVDYFDQEPAN